jgi:hypothetical protein
LWRRRHYGHFDEFRPPGNPRFSTFIPAVHRPPGLLPCCPEIVTVSPQCHVAIATLFGERDRHYSESKEEHRMSVTKAEKTGEVEQAAATAAVEQVEGEIRAFVRRDISVFRRTRSDATVGDNPAENANSIIDRVAGASVTEIERVMAELSGVRDILRAEGERVQREIAGYASLSQAAMTSMKIIGDSLVNWKHQSTANRS